MDPDGNIYFTKAGMLDIDPATGALVDSNGNFVLGTSATEGKLLVLSMMALTNCPSGISLDLLNAKLTLASLVSLLDSTVRVLWRWAGNHIRGLYL